MAVHVVWDHNDTPELISEIARRASPERRVVLAQPTPGTTTQSQLAVDLLIGLGKTYNALSAESQTARAWALVQLWLRAERIDHLVVVDAQQIKRALRTALRDLDLPHIWEVRRHQAPDERQTVGTAEMLAAIPAPSSIEPTPRLEDIELPSATFLTFRVACRDLLEADAFQRVDAVYLQTYAATRGWLRDIPTFSLPTRLAITEHVLALTREAQSAAEVIVRLRAAQAAYFCDGILLNVGSRTVHHAATDDGPHLDIPPIGLHRGVTRRLRRIVRPDHAAALTLLLAGLQPGQIARLRIVDISPSGCRVTVPHLQETHIGQLPRHAGGLIRAQLLDRRSSGARPHERLLVGGQHQPCFGYEIARLANRGAQHTHLWQPADEFAPLWHPSPSTTLTVDVEPLGELRH